MTTAIQSTKPMSRVELRRVIERWEHLEEHSKRGILAIVDTEAIGKPQSVTPAARKLFDGLTADELPLFHSWFHDRDRGFIQGSPIESNGGTYRWDGKTLEVNGFEVGTWQTLRRVIGETTIRVPVTSNPEAQRLFEGLTQAELGFFDRWFFDGRGMFLQGTPGDQHFPQHRWDGQTLQRRDGAGQSWATVRAMLEPCIA